MKDNTAAVHAQVPVDVATFLLNEKRVDLQLLEARHRVNVLLIPNVHLQTPNYTVARLRHDDLNQSEPLAPSYEMVQLPAEEEKTAAGSEAAPPRPEAAVKGITPLQPAPIPAAVPVAAPAQAAAAALPASGEEGIIGKIMGWFRRKPAAEAVAAAAEPARAAPRPAGRNGAGERSRGGRPQRGERGAGSGGRGERHERGERGRGQRGQRGERGDRPEREAGEPRNENSQRRGRGEGREQRRDSRPDRDQSVQPKPAELETQQNLLPAETADTIHETPTPAQDNEQASEERSGGRRRRGRRGGAERSGEVRAEGGQQQRGDRVWYPRTPFVPGPDVATLIPSASAQPVEELVKETVQSTAPLAVTPPAPVIPVPSPVVAETEVRAAAIVETPPAPALTPEPEHVTVMTEVAEAPKAEPRIVAAPSPVKLEWSSDLQQVETRRDRVEAAMQNADDGAPRRVKRVRPPMEHVSNEPLQQVETRT